MRSTWSQDGDCEIVDAHSFRTDIVETFGFVTSNILVLDSLSTDIFMMFAPRSLLIRDDAQ